MMMNILRGKLWFLAVAAWLLLTPMITMAAEKCPVCSFQPKGARFLVTMENGKQVAYGCPHCAFSVLEPVSFAKAQATDFMSRSLVEARKAFYLKDSTYGECCFYWLTFAKKEHAVNFAKGFGGQVLTFDEALKAVGK